MALNTQRKNEAVSSKLGGKNIFNCLFALYEKIIQGDPPRKQKKES